MEKNSNGVFIIIAGLLIASALSDKRIPLLTLPKADNLINDFHRMVRVMDKFDNIGMMAMNSNELQDSLTSSNSSSLPDLSGLANALGPILNNFNVENLK